MNAKVFVAAILAASVATPAFAATYYVVQNTKTQKCSVAATKPSATSKALTLVGDSAGYQKKKDATAAIATVEACKAAT
jgi:hypothetical protein